MVEYRTVCQRCWAVSSACWKNWMKMIWVIMMTHGLCMIHSILSYIWINIQSHILSLFIKPISIKPDTERQAEVSSFWSCVCSEIVLSHILTLDVQINLACQMNEEQFILFWCWSAIFDQGYCDWTQIHYSFYFVATLSNLSDSILGQAAAIVPLNLSGLNLLLLCFHSTHCPAMLYMLQGGKKPWTTKTPCPKKQQHQNTYNHVN